MGASERAFLGVSALLFAASAALTIVWCSSMSAMGDMPTPGVCTRPAHGVDLAGGHPIAATGSVSASAAAGHRRGSLRADHPGESWMRMPGQTWPGAAASFVGMWVVMMVAMMMPSLVPMLSRYRQAVGRTAAAPPTSPFERRRGLAVALRAEADKATASSAEAPRRRVETRLGRLTALVGVGYFVVWTVFGAAAFPLGAALTAIVMQHPSPARAVPIAVGVVVLIAGALQFTTWKARHLACCREASASARAGDGASFGETWPKRLPAAEGGPLRGRTLPGDAGTAWRHGLRLGLHCSCACSGLMAILLVVGVMDLRVMAVVTAAITVERLAPAGERIARAIGAVVVAAGLFMIARAAGLG
jgi:predicted metal-binding membrane protein